MTSNFSNEHNFAKNEQNCRIRLHQRFTNYVVGCYFQTHVFTRGFYLEMEIKITFFYENQFQQMIPFSKELIELYNWASGTIYKLCAEMQFFQPCVFSGRNFLENQN